LIIYDDIVFIQDTFHLFVKRTVNTGFILNFF